MKQNNNVLFMVLMVSIILCGCAKITYIDDEETAKKLVEAVRENLDKLNADIPTPFDSPDVNFNGVRVNGIKERDSVSTGGITQYWEKTEIGITFEGLRSDNLIIRTGDGSYNYYYLRRWQGLDADNATVTLTLNYKLNSCWFIFKQDRKKHYQGIVTINYDVLDNLATKYKATVSFEDGRSFTITGTQTPKDEDISPP